MRVPFICGNWKMYKTIPEALAFVEACKPRLAGIKDVEIGLAAPFTALKSLADVCRGSNIRVGGQNCHWEEQGAFTGEISPAMLRDAGCAFVVIGHSERRQYFGETDETVNRKIKAALKAGLQVIMCIGETLQQREKGETMMVLEKQVRNGLAGMEAALMARMVIAYEPVWAIGTGKTATPGQAQEAHAFIRGVVKGIFNADMAASIRIQYGGSVKPENIRDIMAQPDVDGALVGGASLAPDSFEKLVKFRQ